MSAFSRLAAKIGAVKEEFGTAKGCLYLINRVLEPRGSGIHLYYFVAQPVPVAASLPPGRGRTISVREVGPDDPALRAMPLTQDVIGFRTRQGAVCLGAFKDEAMIGCIWLCFGPFLEDEVRSRFVHGPSGETVWDFDFYLLPQHRSGLAFARLWDEANAYMRARGIKWTISRISALNLRSLASHGRLGARRVGKALYIRLGWAQLSFSPQGPKVYLSLNGRHIPEMRIGVPESQTVARSHETRTELPA